LLTHSRADEARAFLQSALEFSPTDLMARNLLAQADSAANQPRSANAESYLALSLQRYQEGRYAEAIAACRAALALRPDYAEAWNNICAACNKLGRYDEAASACEKALHYKPDFELARNNLQYAREMKKASGK
jgi:Flp pilus assembly protein TadD